MPHRLSRGSMAVVRVRALAAFTHKGIAHAAGDVLEVDPVQAILLHNRRLVSLTRELGPVTRPMAIHEKTDEAVTIGDRLDTTIDTRDEPHSDEGGSPETPVRRKRPRSRKAEPDDAHD
jgi:hypothetical protein